MKRIFTLIAIFTLCIQVQAQVTYGVYNFDGTGSTCGSRVATISTNNLGVDGTWSNFADGAGAPCSGTTGTNRWTSVGFNAASSTDAITNDDYFGFTLTLNNSKSFPNENHTITFTRRISNITNAPKCFVRAKWGSGSFTTYGSEITLTTSDVSSNITITAPGNTSTTQLEVRFYVYSAGSAATTFRVDDVTLLSSASALPIKLLEFTASKLSEKVKVQWTTATEINNDKFIVERSADGKEFDFVTEVKGAGNSKEINKYEIIDESPLKGTSYYRLTQIDYDGRSETFAPVAVKMDAKSMDVIANSSELGSINLNVFSPSAGEGTLVIRDLSGRTIVSEKIILTEGYQNFNINSHNLQGGIHLIQLVNGAEVVVKKLIL